MAECIVRIHLILNSDLTPFTSNTGHFDIQLRGSVTIKGKVYSNPIISYAGEIIDNKKVGAVTIWNNGNYTLEKNKMLCTFSLETSSFDPLETWLNANCTFSKSENGSDIYQVTKGEFTSYSPITHSCFAATAVWCDLMGYSYLKTLYEKYTYPNGMDSEHSETGYKNYTAWPLFKTYHRAWNFAELNVG